MLQKPDLADDNIIACLRDEFHLRVAQLTFLPLGADLCSAVYRADSAQGGAYFVKLRCGEFDANSVRAPAFLAAQGIAQIIAPIAAWNGALWAEREPFRVMVYPYVHGQDGFQVKLSAPQWADFGAALKKIHATFLSGFSLPRETFTPRWRDLAYWYVQQASTSAFRDPLARRLAERIRSKRTEILGLTARAQELGEILQAQAHDFVLCHADIHAGNLLIQKAGALFIVDWDTVMLAPRERDLMFIGGAQGYAGYTPEQETELFYRGYGAARVNAEALAYYRYERIVQDIAVECEQIFSGSGDTADRAQALNYFQSNFVPHGTLARAYAADPRRAAAKAHSSNLPTVR